MILLYCILVIILLVHIGVGYFNKISSTDYMSYENTLPIKGFFTLMVMISHFSGYIQFEDTVLDNAFLAVNSRIGQLMVAMFFFYSGYGISKRIQNDGQQYLKLFFKRRFLPLWIQFATCIVFYIIYNSLNGITYSKQEIFSAFFGLVSIGNSNWFIFDTFVIYGILIIIGTINCKSSKINLIVFLSLIFISFYSLWTFKPYWWWDTFLCFPAGLFFGFYRIKFDLIMSKINYVGAFLVLVSAFVISYELSKGYNYFLVSNSMLFSFIVVLLMIKIPICGGVLSYIGKHVFSIYIIQRLWYMVFQNIVGNRYLYFLICFIFILVSSVLFDTLFSMFKKKTIQQ